MKVLGRVLITDKQQRTLAAGGTIDIPRDQFRAHVKGAAHIGDALWVQEPYWEYLPKNRFTSQTVHGIVPCALFDKRVRPKSAGNGPVRTKRRDGSRLPRVLSRFTLEITAVLPDHSGIRCAVYAMQIDTFRHARRAA